MITRVSELIKIDEIRKWRMGDIITIKAGTGVGKSYFIKNILYAFAKQNNQKILMLIHRTNCINQFLEEIKKDKKTDVIHIRTYQSIETMFNKYNKEYDFTDYQYIVCDEFHYFMSDAAFNKLTDISLNLILQQCFSVKIFMSATGNYMKRYINNTKQIQTIDYELPITYDFIKALTFFNKDETMEKFIEEAIKKKNKAIFFIQSAQKAYKLYEKYKDYTIFNCSKSNDEYYKYVDKNKIKDMLKNERFDELILITTTCLDAGVNIKDKEVKHIVVDVEDTGSLIQCIGRRRIDVKDKNDSIYVYIKTITNQQLGGKKTQLIKKLKMADYLREHTVEEYTIKYGRELDYSKIVYDESIYGESNKCTKKINELMYYKCKIDITDIDTMLFFEKYGYCKYLANIFGFMNRNGYFNYRLIDEDYKKDDLEQYLGSIVGKVMLQVRDRKELIEKIDVKSNGKLLKKINNLNGALEEIGVPFRIIEFSTSKMINDKQKKYPNAWRVNKLTA